MSELSCFYTDIRSHSFERRLCFSKQEKMRRLLSYYISNVYNFKNTNFLYKEHLQRTKKGLMCQLFSYPSSFLVIAYIYFQLVTGVMLFLIRQLLKVEIHSISVNLNIKRVNPNCNHKHH